MKIPPIIPQFPTYKRKPVITDSYINGGRTIITGGINTQAVNLPSSVGHCESKINILC